MQKLKTLTMAGLFGVTALTAVTPAVHATEIKGTTEVTETTENLLIAPPHLPSEEQTLDVEVGIDKKLEVPLTMNAMEEVFFNCPNINPGDVLKATIVFKNTSKEQVQVSIVDALNMLTEDRKAIALLDELELEISVNGELNFKGIHSKVTSPVTNWINVPAGGELPMTITVTLPKTADNRFQNALMHVKWVFQTRADVPPDPTDEETQTGDEKKAGYGIYMLGGAAVVLVAGVGVMAISKKKKNDSDNTNN